MNLKKEVVLSIHLKGWSMCSVAWSCLTLCNPMDCWLSATPWTVAHQALLSMGFPRQKCWSKWPFPPPGDLPDSGIKPESPAFLALVSRFFTTVPPGKSKGWRGNPKQREKYVWDILGWLKLLPYILLGETRKPKSTFHRLPWNQGLETNEIPPIRCFWVGFERSKQAEPTYLPFLELPLLLRKAMEIQRFSAVAFQGLLSNSLSSNKH